MDELYRLRSRQPLSAEHCQVLATIRLKIDDKINSTIGIQYSLYMFQSQQNSNFEEVWEE